MALAAYRDLDRNSTQGRELTSSEVSQVDTRTVQDILGTGLKSLAGGFSLLFLLSLTGHAGAALPGLLGSAMGSIGVVFAQGTGGEGDGGGGGGSQGGGGGSGSEGSSGSEAGSGGFGGAESQSAGGSGGEGWDSDFTAYEDRVPVSQTPFELPTRSLPRTEARTPAAGRYTGGLGTSREDVSLEDERAAIIGGWGASL